ncbi:MAG TPA: tRNA (5-methylaminomethyl-2-thiouridine)(34)-methyltransferase MnmD [Caulobacteraceae bacterium]|nr:tRNA (5-methylaminomethyl-2-thiouridine)(34)-methyltransferase MnmD [Caulobacteraceae bacterium]
MPPEPPPSPVAPSPVLWDDGGPPRSRRHGDVYFSRDDGLAESRAVFLAGCGLPHAWAGRRRFTVGEVGFGTGLNIAALLELWSRTRPPDGKLTVFTVEADPLDAADAARALSSWPELAPIAGLMTTRWPGRAHGFHRIDLPELAAVIDVAILEAAEALAAWDGAADAWFLDGFAPTLDPHIWRREVIDLVARRSAPGARAATYTVAGAVRRALSGAGFTLTRAPGHGRKRERLEAWLPGEAPERPPPPRVAIIGAGIAGAALRRAFSALGAVAAVFDASGPGSGGSGAPAALMAPRLDAGLGPPAALFAQAARTAARLYETIPDAVIARGAWQLPMGPKDPARFAAIARSDLFEPADMRLLSADEAGSRLGEAAPAGLAIEGALVLEPACVLDAWLGEVVRARVAAIERAADGASAAWRLLGEGGAILAEADVVCLAAAMGTADLVPGLALTPVRGQACFTEATGCVAAAIFGAYVIPTRGGVLFGATHDRGETATEPRAEDRRRNLEAVGAALPALARRLAAAPLADWCAVRATTSDYLPMAGRAPDAPPGLWLLTGLGSRGFCLAPVLAEHVAAEILGAPSPLPRPLAALIDPGRFAARAARKGRPRT